MKRTLIAVLIIVIASSSAFAAKGEIGGTLYPDAMISTSDGTTVLGVILMAEGANYFGADGGFGIEYGLGGWFPLANISSEGAEFSFGGALFAGKAGLAYDLPLGEAFDLVFSLGLKLRTLVIVNIFDLYGTVTASFDLNETLAIKTGLTAGCTLFGGLMGSGDVSLFPAEDGVPIITASPFVGLSFVY